jgi:threonine synthase
MRYNGAQPSRRRIERANVRYESTRGEAPVLGFEDVLLTGLALDGGLYLPQRWPQLDAGALRALAGRRYAEQAEAVIRPFTAGGVADNRLHRMLRDAYAGFDHPAVAPLHQLDDGLWLMDLFHGPTLAFKDYALQLVGRLFDAVLAARGARVTIVGATSGDTGSAAIEACRDRAAVDIFILYPHGRVSEVQRRQMTTVDSDNVHNIAVEGSFDDCQDLVKAMFNDRPFREALHLSAVNSINWARIMAQIVYYVRAAVALGGPDRPVAFAVPTGNFGNVFAGYAARRMGVAIDQFVLGSNVNDGLTRLVETGVLAARAVVPTLSPSMDIQIPSNLERLLYELFDRDGARLAGAMQAYRAEGELRLDDEPWQRMRALFAGHRIDDDETKAEIARVHAETGALIDPHTAVGVAAARAKRRDPAVPMVAVATAHPAKFPDAVAAATGVTPALPPRLADLYDRPERCTVLPNDLTQVQAFLRDRARVAVG